ncbi:Indoleamine 2,3-dioxygenase [Cylindrobasidium torrendii FP15055 ss-10]|uniref:Indoleamine 2,3-dioxygenase n=1 Tax=Cylindrobasidium torrendii FP15055 ss-10 TaxID=1314674 RepID=A0A0D7B4J3_9AGAR|nr:Indoleamine 2,3-dioxygenase [Cylindrobasidium torrendii FP15055 ss-10]
MAQSTTVSLSDFDIHSDTGLLPTRPLPPLPTTYASWTKALSDASRVLSLGEDDSKEAIAKRGASERWRSDIRSWPILDTTELTKDVSLLKQAHRHLAFLVHYYIHSIPPCEGTASVCVPAPLAVPLAEVSRLLGMAPVLTYADTVLWNWEFIDPSAPLSAENMHITEVFSGTDDERQFHAVSAATELRGVEAIRIIDDFNHLASPTSPSSITKLNADLARLTSIIEDMSDIIQSVQPVCDPHVFYWQIRPWFCGSDGRGPETPEWVYEGVPRAQQLDLSGPSGGQSTTIHALDAFLAVDHRPRAAKDASSAPTEGFMHRMRRYMPGRHRAFLEYLDDPAVSVRELALQVPQLRDSYDAAVMALKRMRDLHMRVVCRYIVNMSRTHRHIPSGCPVSAMIARMETERGLRGTGGNELSILLKATRDSTKRALLKNSL